MRTRVAISAVVGVLIGGALLAGPLAPTASAVVSHPGDTTGRVLDGSGQPRARCEVTFIDSQRIDYGVWSMPTHVEGGPPEYTDPGLPSRLLGEVMTDGNGRFAVPLLPGHYQMLPGCSAPPWDYDDIDVPAGGVSLGDVRPHSADAAPVPVRWPVSGG